MAVIGDQRLAVSNKFEDTLMVFEHDGTRLSQTLTIPSGAGPSPILTADILGDSGKELIVVDAFADSVSVYELR